MKAILVLDEMPKNCAYCPCFYDEIEKCQVAWRAGYEEKEKPSWCPIKEMPQEKEYREIPHSLDLDGMRKRSRDLYLHHLDVDNSYVMGWNECIEEIER